MIVLLLFVINHYAWLYYGHLNVFPLLIQTFSIIDSLHIVKFETVQLWAMYLFLLLYSEWYVPTVLAHFVSRNFESLLLVFDAF